MIEWLGHRTQQWGAEGVFEILRPAFEPGLRIKMQFAPIWNEYIYIHTHTHIYIYIYKHIYIHTYVFVVNFDALAQASDIQIERRQVVFLC